MKFIISFFVVAFLISCVAPKVYKPLPVRGNYYTPPFQEKTSKTFEEVWDKLIDVFAQRGLPIKIIDKSSGLIVSDRTLLRATNEKQKVLELKDSTAYLVVPVTPDYVSRSYKVLASVPGVSGEWNVRLKRANNETLININIVNVEREVGIGADVTRTAIYDYKSTGVFEKILCDLIK